MNLDDQAPTVVQPPDLPARSRGADCRVRSKKSGSSGHLGVAGPGCMGAAVDEERGRSRRAAIFARRCGAAVTKRRAGSHQGQYDKKCEGADRVFEIRSDAVTRAFERAVARARKLYIEESLAANLRPDSKFLTDLRFHDLRHEATSRFATIFPMHELTKITGHKDPRMLMRYYHPRAEDLAKRLS